MRPEKLLKREHIPIILILILAFFLRFLNILINGEYTFREGTWCMAAWRVTEGDLPYYNFFHAHPPLSPLLLAVVFLVFGVGIIQARLFVIFVTTFACFMIYQTGKRIDEKIGLLGSIIYAATPILVKYGMFAVNDYVAVTFVIVVFYFLISGILDKYQVVTPKMENFILILAGISLVLVILVQTAFPSSSPKFINRLIIFVGFIIGYNFLMPIIKRDTYQAISPEIKETSLILAGVFLGLGTLVKTLFAPFFLAFIIILLLEGWMNGINAMKQIENISFFALGFLISTISLLALFYGIAGDEFIEQIFEQHMSKRVYPLRGRFDIAIKYLAEENLIFFIFFLFSAPFAVRTAYGRSLLICIATLIFTIIFIVPSQYRNYYQAALPFMAMVSGFFPIPLSWLKSNRLEYSNLLLQKIVKFVFATILISLIVVSNIDYDRMSRKDIRTIEWLRANTSEDEYILTDNLCINIYAKRRSPFAEISIDRMQLHLLSGKMCIQACYEYDIRVIVKTGRLFGKYRTFEVFLDFLSENYEEIDIGHDIYIRKTSLRAESIVIKETRDNHSNLFESVQAQRPSSNFKFTLKP